MTATTDKIFGRAKHLALGVRHLASASPPGELRPEVADRLSELP